MSFVDAAKPPILREYGFDEYDGAGDPPISRGDRPTEAGKVWQICQVLPLQHLVQNSFTMIDGFVTTATMMSNLAHMCCSCGSELIAKRELTVLS